MSTSMNRRSLAGLLAAAPVVLAAGRAMADATPHRAAPPVETRSLDELHRAAMAEGGQVTVYAGGDVPNAYAGLENAFKARFPGMKINIFTDLSKYHDARIDLQLARGRLEADIAILQTLHDFDRWKSEGKLLPYKPLDWDMFWPESRDVDGAFHSVGFIAFSNTVNISQIPLEQAPRDALDFLDPKLKGKIVLTYPHDDDAVLYEFDRIVGAHGWEYMDRLMQQDVKWIRGTVPARLVVQNGERAVSFTSSGPLVAQANTPLRFQLPRKEAFLSWPQTAAIFAEAPHKEGARLFLSWMASREATISRTSQWSVRRDVTGPEGVNPIWSYNTAPTAFHNFMVDRARVERLKTQFEHIIGPAVGANPTGTKGIYLLGA
ncbi:extracellular solute-binding protein [Acetobacteraceae bacterium H6797]|nr:extracellular solute-binding protein [Acetobacteraceae bacterium H6797]